MYLEVKQEAVFNTDNSETGCYLLLRVLNDCIILAPSKVYMHDV